MALYSSAKYLYDQLYEEWKESFSNETLKLMKETDKLCTILLLNELAPKIINEVIIEQQQYSIAA